MWSDGLGINIADKGIFSSPVTETRVKQFNPLSLVLLLLLSLVACGGGGGGDISTPNSSGNAGPPTPPPIPANLVFFQDNAQGAGDGSNGSPFSSFAAALAATQPGETLIVLRGSGNPIVFNGTVPANVTLHGQGVAFTSGTFTVPAAGFPRLQGQFNLSNGATLRGFQLENATGGSIVLNSIQNATIDNNRFTNLTGQAIDLSATTGTVTISNNQFADDNTTNPLNGVQVVLNQTEVLTLVMSNNTFSTPDRLAGFDFGLSVQAQGNSQLNLTLSTNTFDVLASGLSLQFTGNSRLTTNISGNTFSSPQLDAITIIAGQTATDTVVSNVTASNNQFNSPLGPGILLRARGTTASTHGWTVNQNTVTAGGNFGLLFVRGDSAFVRADVTNNTVSNAGQVGIQYTSGTASGGFGVPLLGEDRIIVSGNQTTGSGVTGINLNLINATQATALTGNTTATPVTILSRATTACLAAGNNTVGGTLNVNVEAGFSLTYEDRGQTTPTTTFPGAGTVTPGNCNP